MNTVLILGCVAGLALLTDSQPVNQEAANKAVQKQIRQLKTMKCRPTKQKITVRGILSPENDLLDVDFWPTIVMVKRCNDLCSYCGNNIGVETKTCQPTQTKMKKFQVVHYSKDGKRQYEHFRAEEHQRCNCQKVVNSNNGTTSSN